MPPTNVYRPTNAAVAATNIPIAIMSVPLLTLSVTMDNASAMARTLAEIHNITAKVFKSTEEFLTIYNIPIRERVQRARIAKSASMSVIGISLNIQSITHNTPAIKRTPNARAPIVFIISITPPSTSFTPIWTNFNMDNKPTTNRVRPVRAKNAVGKYL